MIVQNGEEVPFLPIDRTFHYFLFFFIHGISIGIHHAQTKPVVEMEGTGYGVWVNIQTHFPFLLAILGFGPSLGGNHS